MSECEHDSDGHFSPGNHCGGSGDGKSPSPLKHTMPVGKVEDPSSAYSWLSPSGVFHPFPRNKPAALRLKNPIGFTSHHEWAQAHGVAGGEAELQSHGWARVVPGGKTLYAGTGEGKQLTTSQKKALRDHAIIVGSYDDVVHENVRRKSGPAARPIWQKDDRAWCPTGPGGGQDNSCGKNDHGDVRIEENNGKNRELFKTSLGVEASHAIRVHDGDSVKAVMLADVDDAAGVVRVMESFVPEQFQNKGVYTSLLKTLSEKYRVVSDVQLSTWAEKAYKKLGADFNNRDGRYELDNRKNKWAPATLKSAAVRWKGDTSDLGLHMQDIIDGKPAPTSGTGMKLREMAHSLLDEVKHNSKPAPTLYRGDNKDPSENTSPLLGWTSNKKVASQWAAYYGGQVYTLEGANGVELKPLVGDAIDNGEDEWIVANTAFNKKQSRSADCGRDEGGRFAAGNTCQAIAEDLADLVGDHEAQSGVDIPDLYGKDGKQTDIGRKLHQMNVKEDELAGLIKRMGGEPARTRAQIVHPGIHITVVSPKGKSLYHIDLGYMEAKIYSTGARDDDLEKIKADAASVFPKVYFRKGTDFEVHANEDDADFKAGKSHSRCDVGMAARIASLHVFAESRNCGIGPGGFQVGNTCAHSKGADVAKGAAKGAALGAASAVVGAAPYGPYVAKGAAVGAATGAAKGLIDHSSRAGRIKAKIAEIGTTEKKVDDMVRRLGGTSKTRADVVGGALHISIVNAHGQKAFNVDMTKDRITVYPRRPTGRLSDAEIVRVRDIAKKSAPKTTEIVVKSHSKSYVAKLIRSGFRVLANAAGVLVAAYVVPPVADIAHGEIKYEINRHRRKR